MAIPKKKRQKAVNAFGEELYVPEIQLPEFDTDLGFDTPDIETEDLNLDLFDYDREDNNSDVRYMRPRPARMPTACVRYDNADALARDIKFKAGMRYDMFVSGSFIFGDFIEAFLRHNNCKAVNYELVDRLKADFYQLPSGERIHPVSMWHRHKTRAWDFLQKQYPGIIHIRDGEQLKFVKYL